MGGIGYGQTIDRIGVGRELRLHPGAGVLAAIKDVHATQTIDPALGILRQSLIGQIHVGPFRIAPLGGIPAGQIRHLHRTTLAGDVLKQSKDDFLQLARKSLEGEQKDHVAQLEQRKQAVEALVKPINEKLKEMGFTNVSYIDGGMRGWKEAGLPTIE